MKTYCLRLITGCLFSLLFPISFYGQQIISKPMPFLNQLSVNSINTLYQDKQGFIWVGTYAGLVRYDGYSILEFRNDFQTPERLASNDITSFAEDNTDLWVGTNRGINLIDKTTYRISPFFDNIIGNSHILDLLTDKKGNIWITTSHAVYICNSARNVKKMPLPAFSPIRVYEDNSGILWVLTWHEGLFRYSEKDNSFVKYPPLGLTNNPYRLYQDNKKRYWIVTWGDGIWSFDPESSEKEMYTKQTVVNTIRNHPENIFFDIVQDNTYGYLWALSHFELYILEVNNQGELQKVDVHKLSDTKNSVDKHKSYSRIIKDNKGNLWIGAYDEGAIINFERNHIKNYLLDKIKETLSINANIICLHKDKEGIFWLNQARYGLCLYNEKTEEITYRADGKLLYSFDFTKIIPSREDNVMWLGGRGTYSKNVFKMRQKKMQVSVMERIELSKILSFPGDVVELVEDIFGNLWIGTTRHLFVKTKNTKEISVAPFDISGISDMKEDSKGNIWIAAQHGIYQVKYDKQPILMNDYSTELEILENDKIKNLCVDKNDKIWFATTLGRLFQFNPEDQTVVDQTYACDLKGDAILRLLPYNEYIWIIFNKYLILHNQYSKENIVYSVNDENISLPLLRYGSAFVDTDGSLYAGGYKGFISIASPSATIREKEMMKKVRITDVKMDNRSILFTPDIKEITNSVHEVTLQPDAKNIEIQFSSLDYVSNKKIKYAYMLEGEDNRWNYIGNGKHAAFYNRLNKGKYIFHVKSADRYGNWSEQETLLTINQLPAIYETWYARLLYVILTTAILIFGIKYYFRRINERNKVKLQEELTQIKLNYFTNISHELLTPLTVISCVADDLEENRESSEQQVSILRTNVSRLKRLLQQILDFRKIESNKMPLNVEKGNISSFISSTVASNFQSLARKKNIRLTTRIGKSIWGYMDFDKVDKILFNLLSNAIKYTPEGKQVNLTADISIKGGYRYLVVQVEDQGLGIGGEEIKRIFTKFYTNKSLHGYESNGIDLSLTKELATLHHGTIEVCSEVEKGSIFTIEIPIDREVYDEQEISKLETNMTKEDENMSDDKLEDNRPCILLIDDNEDLQELMRNVLRNKYQVFTARDGEEGLELLNNNAIDIIICDMMMPLMDGLEFCRRVKQDMQISHIPVLMLTVKNAIEDQIDCYKAGAEGYIAKPFEMKILQARIDNLLQAREMRQHSFRSKMSLNISNLDYQTVDGKFLKDAIQCIEQHLSNSDFDIPQMAEKLNMSRATLTRKSRAITGLSPLELLRNVKLKHACILLEKKSATISEIAYTVGFTSSRYFTQCFKQEFGITPTEYQNKEVKDIG